MIILEDVLKKMVSIPKDIYEITSLKITEVESFRKNYLEDIKNLVVGYVLECKPHENSDHLSVVKVDVGSEVLQIVCGASNIASKQTVIVAKVGATLPGDFKISEVNLRGVKSSGMICSLEELGLKEFNYQNIDGIFTFDKKIKPGTNAIKALGLDNFLLELELTPNRGDLLSYYGFSKDLAAASGRKVKEENFSYKKTEIKNPFKVKIEDPNCHFYSLRYFSDVKIKPSPFWLASFLIRMGLKPQNNVVDITNYILLKYGTPLHAFDSDLIGKEIVIRKSEKGEKVETLDSKEYNLKGFETLITDGKKPIALGGVMGLKNSMIRNNTVNIALEGAIFSQENILLTTQGLKLETDSSLRFKRGVSESVLKLALNEASYLLVKYADAKLSRKVIEKRKKKEKAKKITISVDDMNDLIGFNLTKEEVIKILKRLNFEILESEEKLKVSPPLYRFDINIKEDVTEEVARIYGYNKIKGKEGILELKPQVNPFDKFIFKIKDYLINRSHYEVITHSLISQESAKKYSNNLKNFILKDPLTVEKSIMRTNLLPSLINTYLYNLNRDNTNLNFFEISNIYYQENNKLMTKKVLGVITKESPNIKSRLKEGKENLTFYTKKAILENLCSLFGIKLNYKKSNYPYFHPGFQADILIDDENLGQIGKIYPYDENYNNLFYFEIDLNILYQKINYRIPKIKEISPYPKITRDIAFIISKEYSYLEIINKIKELSGSNLIDIKLFDLYPLDNNNYSLAIRLTFNSNEKTLLADDINKIVENIKLGLKDSFNTENR